MEKRRSVPSFLGPIPVKYVEGLVEAEDVQCIGTFTPGERLVRMEKELSPAVHTQGLWHEWLHSVLFDSGVDAVLEKKQVEAVCDSVGTALAAFAKFK